MGFEPSRLLETRHPDDAALCREIERFKRLEGPSESELRTAHEALKRDLGAVLSEPLTDADSGVRVLPQPLFPALIEPARARRESGRPDPEFEFWTNATVSRTLATFAAAALIALLWSRADRQGDVIAAEQTAQTGLVSQGLGEPQPADPGVFVRRNPLVGQDSEPEALPAETTSKPAVRARAAVGANSKRLRSAAVDGDGKLNINSIPYSRVVLDGRPLGATPRVEVAVSPGAHTVVFVHPEHGRILKEVYVDAGRTVLAAVRFQ